MHERTRELATINLVFTMAGKYTRFQAFGHKVPKYLFPFSTGTVLYEVIRNLLRAVPNANIHLIANRSDQLFVPIIKSIVDTFENSNSQVMFVDDTAGQVETASHIHNFRYSPNINDPICFANIDTILCNRHSYFEMLRGLSGEPAGLIDTFKGSSHEYSYCQTGADGQVTHLAEKRIISNDACSGLYGFGSLDGFSKITSDLLKSNRATNFSDVYNAMIDSGLNVYNHLAPQKSDTLVLGTPEEYIKNIHRLCQ